MTIKRNYIKPEIEEHVIDRVINLGLGSPILPPMSGEAPPDSKTPPAASPQFENPSKAEYPFGGDSPDFSNM